MPAGAIGDTVRAATPTPTPTTTDDDGEGAGIGGQYWSVDAVDMLLIYMVLGSLLVMAVTNVVVRFVKRREKSGSATGSTLNNSIGSFGSRFLSSRLSHDSYGTEPCTWINACVSWFFLHQDRSPDIVNAWIQGLNEYARVHPSDDVIIKFDHAQAGSLPPVLSNIKVLSCDNESLTVVVDIECVDIVILMSAARTNRVSGQFGQQSQGSTGLANSSLVDSSKDISTVSNWDMTIDKLRGQLQITATSGMDNDIHLSSHLIQKGNKSVKVQTSLRPRSQNPCCNAKIVKEIIENSLINSTTRYQLMKAGAFPYNKMDIQGCLSGTYSPMQMMSRNNISPKKPERKCDFNNSLVVKVIKANGLTDKEFAQADTYCVLSVDYPHQLQRTSVVNNTINPFWDEHFVFELSMDSSHLEFSVYDLSKHGQENSGQVTDESNSTLLGRANLQISALSTKKTSSRQIIPLTAVSPRAGSATAGSITVELVYREELANQVPLRISTGSMRHSGNSPVLNSHLYQKEYEVQNSNFNMSHDEHNSEIFHRLSNDNLSRTQSNLSAHEDGLKALSNTLPSPRVTVTKPRKVLDDDLFIGDTPLSTKKRFSSQKRSEGHSSANKSNVKSATITVSNPEHNELEGHDILSVTSNDVKEKKKSGSFTEAVKRRFRSRSKNRSIKTSSIRSTSSQGTTVFLTPPIQGSSPSPTPSRKTRSRSLSSSLRKIFSGNKNKLERRGSGHIVIPVRETSLPKDAANYKAVDQKTGLLKDEDIQSQRKHLQKTSVRSPEICMSTSAPQNSQVLY